MIYLLITTSINDKYELQDSQQRKERYLYAISETLKILPHEIKPLIVENNGKRETYLDNFYHHHRQHVKVFYTNNNKETFLNKAVNEFLDIKEVIEKYGIEDDDIIIKLTGRYRAFAPSFFKQVIENENTYDAFMKFFNVSTEEFETNNCVLGCFAIRTKFIKLFNHLSLQNSISPEVAFAKYVKLFGIKTLEVQNLDIECCFAQKYKILNV